MDFKTVIASGVVSAVVALTVPAAVNFVTLQPSSPGTPDSGNINITGNVISGHLGVNTTPSLARLQISDTGSLQGIRSITGAGVSVYGQSTAVTGLGAGGYFTSASVGGRAVVGEQLSATGNTVGGLFYTHSANGTGVWGRHLFPTGTAPGVSGETLSTSSNALGVLGSVTSPAAGNSSAGVKGVNNSTQQLGYGVWGDNTGIGPGVEGSSVSGNGVQGVTNSATAKGGFFYNTTAGTQVGIAQGNAVAVQAYGDIQRDYGNNYACAVPIGYGYVNAEGTKFAGTDNWTVTRTQTGYYFISFIGYSFSILNGDMAVMVGDIQHFGVFRADSGSGKLWVISTNLTGTVADSGFQFIAYAKLGGSLHPKLPNTHGLSDIAWASKYPKELDAYRKYVNELQASHGSKVQAVPGQQSSNAQP